MSFFKGIFSESVMKMMVDYTNLYAHLKSSHSFRETSGFNNIGHIIKYRKELMRCAVCHKNGIFFVGNVMGLLIPKRNYFES